MRLRNIRPRNASRFLAVTVLGWAVNATQAGAGEFFDRDEWVAAVGDFSPIDFTGFPDGTFITDQYADLGILFVGGNEQIFLNQGFVNDGAGLNSNFTDIVMEFAIPQFWIAADFPGTIRIDLFNEGELIFSSIEFGGGGVGFFGGLLSSEPFDMAMILGPGFPTVNIDDLFFGPQIPGPPAFGLLALTVCFGGRRRRDRSARSPPGGDIRGWIFGYSGQSPIYIPAGIFGTVTYLHPR